MHIGAIDGALTADGLQTPWQELYARVAELGMEGLELGVKENYGDTQLWRPEGRVALRRAASANGVKTPSICIHSFWHFSFSDNSPEVREQAGEIAREAVFAASEVGASNILIPLTMAEGVSVADARERWITGIKEAAPTAENANISFCLENVGCEHADAPEDIAAIVDAVASPAVGVYYDPGNAVRFNRDPFAGLQTLGERIRHIHVKEVGAAHLGEGIAPWPDIIPAIKDIGYDGWLIFETEGTDDPVDAGRRNLDYLSKLL